MKLHPGLSAMLLTLAVPCAASAQDNLAAKARAILQTHCARCHAPEGKVKGGFDYVLRRDLLAARGKIAPGKAADSELFHVVRDGSMPPRKEKERPSAAEIAALEAWLNASAPDWQPTIPRTFVSDADVLKAVRGDLEALPEPQRRFYRYFSLANLLNGGRPDEEIDACRLALAKLLNSLSWHARLTAPTAIDASRAVYRIDLRDYRWNARLWDRLVAVYPYRTGSNSGDARVAAHLSTAELPLLRADWFVATAARAPLYYDLLEMPSTDRGLERQLQVDTVASIEQHSAARAGFNGSGVSKNNRLIERHDATYGAYWKTYDFAENTDRQNLFQHPLGPPPARDSFVHDGGELIFHLPNGLLGFYLADAVGRRIDRAPVAIVSDPQRPDKIVEAGLSCFSCHAAGLVPKADQVRASVLKNAGSFAKEDLAAVKGLYPTEAKMRALIDEDNRRYQEALQKLGGKADGPEPVTLTALRYEAVVDLASAAAEAGMAREAFAARLGAPSELSRTLGALLAKGGTVQRQVLERAFPLLVTEFRLGDEPAAGSAAGAGKVFGGHTAAIRAIAVASDGKLVASAADDRTARLWDARTGRELRRLEGHRGAVTAVAFTPDGRHVVTGGDDRTLRLWDTQTGQPLRTFTGHTDAVTCVAVSPNGKWLLSGGPDRSVRYWEIATGKEARSFTGHEGRISSVAFSRDGKLVLSGSHDRSVRLWEVASGREVRVFLGQAGEVYSVALSPDGKLVAAGGNDRMVRLWGVDGGQEVRRLEGHANAVIAVRFAPDGKSIFSASSQYQTADRSLRQWDVSSGKELRGYGDLVRSRISCATFASDGTFALTDGPEPVLLLWELKSP